jgi:hypothetical protein
MQIAFVLQKAQSICWLRRDRLGLLFCVGFAVTDLVLCFGLRSGFAAADTAFWAADFLAERWHLKMLSRGFPSGASACRLSASSNITAKDRFSHGSRWHSVRFATTSPTR